MARWTNWFEIPAEDFSRAKAFYEQILDMEIGPVFGNENFRMGVFPAAEVGCALVWGAWYKPSAEGTVVFFDAAPDLSTVLDRVESAGGKILQAKKLISPEQGYMALFADTEGNRFGLRSPG